MSKVDDMSELDDAYKALEDANRMIAFLVERAGGKVVISRKDFLEFPAKWELQSTLDVLTGAITVTAHEVVRGNVVG